MTSVTPAAVLVERRGHTMIITLNRPEARNAVNAAVANGVGQALEEADRDPTVRAAVITGSGDKSFCAGADLKAISRGENVHAPGNESWGLAGFVKHTVSVPTIAAVNGMALGGGAELALAADLIVADENAVFGLPEVKRGLLAGAGGLLRLPAQIPQRLAMELILTGDSITAERALAWGLINRVVPHGTAVEAAVELADRIAENAPLAVQASKRVVLGIVDNDRCDEAPRWRVNDAEVENILTTEDAVEGPRAFTEKRAPVWRGR
ncbi:crotonase/enoyl-CoA hydratase family protein [[Mycobacterium] wendilense]|uniref:Crotonase/enoyl-CoA hydratase family protein n=1 Tax=[Mycobacterium] wendilense TaxID=3064284 RepID=A0ABM9MIG9_9MYCO|nr:crotonase/enoyl-CoA hydratase family protein [Mycolicibacterium sp. MU0050]CAJ1586010.1 crotonase/enoyl-CoA hydratase family protein [Mycolicibacterium sp. MU0050]